VSPDELRYVQSEQRHEYRNPSLSLGTQVKYLGDQTSSLLS